MGTGMEGKAFKEGEKKRMDPIDDSNGSWERCEKCRGSGCISEHKSIGKAPIGDYCEPCEDCEECDGEGKIFKRPLTREEWQEKYGR